MKRWILPLLSFLSIFFASSPISFAQVLINEFQVEPSGSSQWVELYNKGQDSVDISGWIIDDSGGSTSFTVEDGTLLPPLKCASFQSGKFYFNTASSDSARLIHNGEIVDNYSYSKSPGAYTSFARLPDGSDNWATVSNATRDKLNSDGTTCVVQTAMSTPTPTQTKTPMPTSTLKPTKIPTSTKSQATSFAITPTPSTQLQKSAMISVSPTLRSSQGGAQKITQSGQRSSSESEFARASSSLEKSEKKGEAGVLGASSQKFPTVLLIGGALLVISSGILAFQVYKRQKEENGEE